MRAPPKRLAAVLLTLSALGGVACGEPAEPPLAAEELLEMGADQMVFGMVSFLTASGVREGRIEADTAYLFVDSALVVMRQMTLRLYEEDGRDRATVTGESGELDENTDRMVARGNVVLIVHADGRRIESPELHYDPGRDRIWSDSATVQTMPDGRVTRGTAFESDLEFRNVRIANPRGAIGEIVF